MTNGEAGGAAGVAAPADERQRIQFHVAHPQTCDGCGFYEFLRADIPLSGGRWVTARLCAVCDTGGTDSRLQEFLLRWDFHVDRRNSREFAEAARAWLLLSTDPPLLDRVQWFLADPGVCACGARAVLRADVPTGGGRVLSAALCVQCSRGVEASRLLEFLVQADGAVDGGNVREFRALSSAWLRSSASVPWVDASSGR